MSDLRVQIADIIVRKVLQEDYDDLVEGYLDEILLAADQIILLPAYGAVTQAYYDRLASPVVPVGSGEIAAIIMKKARLDLTAGFPPFGQIDNPREIADDILAALRFTDTGRKA